MNQMMKTKKKSMKKKCKSLKKRRKEDISQLAQKHMENIIKRKTLNPKLFQRSKSKKIEFKKES